VKFSVPLGDFQHKFLHFLNDKRSHFQVKANLTNVAHIDEASRKRYNVLANRNALIFYRELFLDSVYTTNTVTASEGTVEIYEEL